MNNSRGYRPSNPFRSANIRPGANKFLFTDPEAWHNMLIALQEHRCCEIVGGHGTGKSTLFHQLTATCESWGWAVRRHVVDPRRPAGERLSLDLIPGADQPGLQRLRAVDGYEQLPRGQRRAIGRHCQEQGERLLITCHTGEGFHRLHQTHVDTSLADRVVAAILQREGVAWAVKRATLDQLLSQHDGNLREVLFAVFDLFAHSTVSPALTTLSEAPGDPGVP